MMTKRVTGVLRCAAITIPSSPPIDVPTPAGQQPRILLAEDTPDTRHLIAFHLRRAGAVVEVARDGLEACTLAARTRFDAILLDMHMPRLDGYGAAARLREAGYRGPIVAVTDFMKAVPDQVARFVPQPFVSLGTDGYGFSDTREALRRHFEVDAAHIVVATLSSLARQGDVKDEAVAEAIQRYGIDAEAIDPRLA